MASTSYSNTILLLTIIITSLTLTTSQSTTTARAPFNPTTLVLPLRKDNATALHITHLLKRTPQVSTPLILDLNGNFVWVNCDQNYSSTTYTAPICHSTHCSRSGIHYCHRCHSGAARPGCHNHTCAVLTTNPLTQKNAVSELAQDVVSVTAIVGSNTTTGETHRRRWATVPQFLFACAPASLLQGPLPQGVLGVAGLGHTPVALPLQLASLFGFRPQFSVCLSPSPDNNGAIFFGEVPVNLAPRALAYTPLTVGQQGEYHVMIKSVRINNQTVPFNTTTLFSRTRGFAGTMISTTSPYTVMEHSVFNAFSGFFAEQMTGTPKVAAVPPFGVCFDARLLPPTRVGAPNIDFVFPNRNVSWRVYGYDALVRVRPNVSCLAVVDGGTNARAAITIGAYQLENNFVHFDLWRSRFGFIPSRLQQPFDCSKLGNFTAGGGRMEMMGV